MIAIDIGGSHISSVEVVDVIQGRIGGELKSSHVKIKGQDKEKILGEWVTNINQCIDSAIAFDGKIAMAFPGPFDYKNGIVYTHFDSKFKPLEGVNLKNELINRIEGCNQIHFQNDAACFGIGEYYYGQHEETPKIMALTIGTGIGCTFIDRGRVVKDDSTVPQGGEVYRLPFKRFTADDYFSTRWFVKRSAELGYELSGVKELIEEGNEELIAKVFDSFVINFLSFFSPIISAFETSTIIIGGNIAKAWEHFGPTLNTYFKDVGVQVIHSDLGEKGICLGAARSMYNQMMK